jgi:ribokinase
MATSDFLADFDVAILGSINMDIVLEVENFPRHGETIVGRGMSQTSGGKGANQAIAAARAGSRVKMVGAVGADQYGADLCAALSENGVDIQAIERKAGIVTGIAHVTVSGRGENMIIVLPGANHAITADSVSGNTPRATVYLAQLEVPLDAIHAFFVAGKSAGGICVLNAAPVVIEAKAVFELCDIIIVNEVELASYLEEDLTNSSLKSIAEKARKLLSGVGQTVIVTLGKTGVLVVKHDSQKTIAGHVVHVVDTTGAGDCFCGVLAAELSKGRLIEDGVVRANAAAAISVGRRGAGLAAPTAQELSNFLSG